MLSTDLFNTGPYLNFLFYYSPMLQFTKIFVCILAICVLIPMLDYFIYENFLSSEPIIVFLLCLQGIFLLISANDFIVMYAAIESQSLALYVLAAQKRFSNLSAEAALKYFIYGSFASGILLYGISLIYCCSATTNYYFLYLMLFMDFGNVSSYSTLAIGFLLVLAGLFLKLGLLHSISEYLMFMKAHL
jgi:NADH-quinone oxidoreductase subunit N